MEGDSTGRSRIQVHTASPLLEESNPAVERIYRRWDEALALGDVAGLIELYAPDATIESPLIPHLLGSGRGICRGRDEIRALLDEVASRMPAARRSFRRRYFTDGRTLMWEYPRATPAGDQMDLVEVMELSDRGLIQHQREYWGWFGGDVSRG